MIVNKGHGTVFCGKGCTAEALGAIYSDAQNPKSVLLVSDAAVDIGPLLYMDYRGMIQVHCEKEPTYEYLESVLKNARFLHSKSRFDFIIAVGGGSALDLAKSIAVLITNEKRPVEYRGFDKVKDRKIPTLLIPTTLSGSEATNSASLLDTVEKRKMGINGRHMFADYVILDQNWLVASDTLAWASTVLDALTHAYESMVCQKANCFTKEQSAEALHELVEFIAAGAKDEDRLTDIQVAAFKAARALCNSGSGIAGALSYALGSLYGVPHGVAGGIFLADVMEFNSNLTQAGVVRKFLKDKKISTDLADYGVESLEELSEYVLTLQEAFLQNPIPFSADKDGAAILKKHFGGPSHGKKADKTPAGDSGTGRSRENITRNRTNHQPTGESDPTGEGSTDDRNSSD